MKNTLNRTQLVLALVAGMALNACGTIDLGQQEAEKGADSPAAEDQQNSVVMDAQLNEEGISASLTDALEAMSDSIGITASVSASASIKLNALDVLRRRNKQRDSSYSKACKEEGLNAVVSVDGSIDRSMSFSNRLRVADWSVLGKEEITRTWSKNVNDADVQVKCDASGKYADIDWKGDLTGLKLDVAFERSRDANLSLAGKLKSVISFKGDRRYSAKGERHISWDSQVSSESGAEFTRTKTISSNVDRSHYRKNSKGVEKQIDINIKTDAEHPLVIETVRKASDLSIVSENIKSGVLIGSRKDDGHIEATFANVLTMFGDDECHLQSGEATYKLFKEGEAEASKSYKLVIVDGEITLTDTITGEVKTDFEFENCDVRSFQE